ncbi:TPA: hypothetical protein ACXORL_001936, partial [Enterococcus faecium]
MTSDVLVYALELLAEARPYKKQKKTLILKNGLMKNNTCRLGFTISYQIRGYDKRLFTIPS